MPVPPVSGRFDSADAQRVADAVCPAFLQALGERLEAFVVHGSAVTGFIPGFSDFDFVVFVHGTLTVDDAFDIQRRLTSFDASPFSYVQLSRVVDVDDPHERPNGLIESAYAVVHGELPADWSLHSDDVLIERGTESLERIPSVIGRFTNDWAVANAQQRRGIVRYLATVLKPAVRALLPRWGEPVQEVWRAPYPELARRLEAHDGDLGKRMSGIIAMLPPDDANEEDVCRRMFALLQDVHRLSENLETVG